jgi:hypothetical protein
MAAKRTLAAGNFPIGSGSEGTASTLVIQTENIAGAMTVQGRVIGSTMGWENLEVTRRAAAGPVSQANIATDDIFTVDIAGLDVRLVPSAAVDIAYAFLTGL